MKKITLISLSGPVLLIILRVVEIIKAVNIYGSGDNYYCNFSTDEKCSLFYYIFKSDYAIISYIVIILSFIFLFAITSYIFFLLKIFRTRRFRLFWILILFTVLIFAVFPFIVNYIHIIG